MNTKNYLKIFSNASDYNAHKYALMGIPHVILLEDTQKVIFTSESTTDGLITVSVAQKDMNIQNDVIVVNGDLTLSGYNVFVEKKNSKTNLIIN